MTTRQCPGRRGDARERARLGPGDLADGRGGNRAAGRRGGGLRRGKRCGVASRAARTRGGVSPRQRKGSGVLRLGAASVDEAVVEVTSTADEATSATTRPRTFARSGKWRVRLDIGGVR